MFNILQYLKKSSGLIDENVLKNGVIINSIKKYTGILCTEDMLEVKNGVLNVKVNSLQKNMLFIKKEAILEDLKSLNITDLR